MNPNNVNTGRSGATGDFQWFKPTSNAHVEAVITSAPDFSIPPTPVSSYSNLHVVLDSVHPSYQTTTSGLVGSSGLIGSSGIVPSSGLASSGGSYQVPSSSVPFINTSSSSRNIPIASNLASRDVPVASTNLASRDVPIASFNSPSRDVPFVSNRIPGIQESSFRAVPDRVNPEQPGARSNEALTSLKSEVAPILPRFVELDEIEEPTPIYDEFAERTDRDLPESVDITLVDESFDQYSKWSKITWDINHKKWNLKHWTAPAHLNKWQDSERQWRSSRTIDPVWSGRMHAVQKELLNTNIATFGWSQWLGGLKRKAVAQSRDLMNAAADATDSALNKTAELMESAAELKDAAVDKAFELKDAAVDKAVDLMSTASEVKESVKDSLLTKAPIVTDARITSSPAPRFFTTSASVAYSDAEPIDFTFWSRRTPASIIAMEEAEREDRIARGADPVLVAKWRQLGLEIAALSKSGSLLWSEWLSGIKNKFSYKSYRLMDAAAKNSLYAASKGLNAVENAAEVIGEDLGYAAQKGLNAVENAAEVISEDLGYAAHKGLDALESVAQISSDLLGYAATKSRDLLVDAVQGAEILADSAASKSIDLMDSAKDSLVKLETFKAPSSLLVPRGADYYYAPIDFTFKARRLPFAIRNLEEQERAWRLRNGASPIILGRWFRLGQELKWKLSLRPTLGLAAWEAKEAVGSAIEKTEEMLGNLSSYVKEKGQDLIDLTADAITPVERVDFATHGDLPLNLFSFTAEPIDFTFRKNRTPASIIALEEKERQERIIAGANPLTYARWSKLLNTPRTTLRVVNPSSTFAVLPTLEVAKESLIESTSDALDKAEFLAEEVIEKGKSWTGYLGSLASGMLNAATHSHLVESAKEKIGIYDAGSIHSINKLEETERTRRMNEKIDPMMMARLTRVQDELLHSVKSV